MKKIFFAAFAILLVSGVVFAQQISQENYSEIYRSIGNFFLKSGNSITALSIYEKGLEYDPENKFILNNLGYYYKDTDAELSEKYFKQALDIDPDYENARNNLALLYNKIKDYDKSTEHLKILVNNNPSNLNYIYDLAINLANKFYYLTKDVADLEQARNYFKQVYEKNPGFNSVKQNLEVLNEIKQILEE